MPNEALLASVKSILGLARSNHVDEAYAGYAELFASQEFASYPAADQRQALKLLIHAKGLPSKLTPPIVNAHRAATGPLSALVAAHDEPEDHELLGLCQVRIDDEAGARVSFKRGLDLERAKNPQSPLCGQLMKLVASV